MTNFFAGMLTGAVVALFSEFCLHKAKTKAKAETAPSGEETRLNDEKKRRAERLKELDRQFDNLMNYKGEEQIKA